MLWVLFFSDAGNRLNRNAFKTTSNELTDIPIAAQPGVIQPNAAHGIINPLYKEAHNKFSIMMRRVRLATLMLVTNVSN